MQHRFVLVLSRPALVLELPLALEGSQGLSQLVVYLWQNMAKAINKSKHLLCRLGVPEDENPWPSRQKHGNRQAGMAGRQGDRETGKQGVRETGRELEWSGLLRAQWHTSFNKAIPSNLSHSIVPTADQAFKCANLWRPFLVKPPHAFVFRWSYTIGSHVLWSPSNSNVMNQCV